MPKYLKYIAKPGNSADGSNNIFTNGHTYIPVKVTDDLGQAVNAHLDTLGYNVPVVVFFGSMVGIYGIGVSAQGDSYHSNVGIPINFAELHVSTITLEPEESGFFEPIPFLVNTLGTMSPLAGFFKTVNGIGDAVSIAGIITQNEAIADIGEQINVGKQVENLLNLASPGMVDALNKIFELDGDLKDFVGRRQDKFRAV